MRSSSLARLSMATGAMLATALGLVFFYAPLDADQGFIQKIFYIPVPLAIVTLCGFIAGGLMAIKYLRSGDRSWDMRSYVAIHLSIVLAVGVLITGSIWAKASWGHWWVWDEPTLVSFLIIFLLYCCYQPLRFSIEDPERQARYAAVFAIIAGAFVPLNFVAVRLAQSFSHPRVLSTTGGNMPGSMRLTFYVWLLALGISHKTAPLALRERLALPEGRAAGVLRDLVAHPEIHEAVAISTCNRTEIYLVASDPVDAESAALSTLSRQAGIPPTELLGSLYSPREMDAARHLFGVASGLESMIVGEAEVQGQVKRAYELALVEGATGPITNRLFRDALATGKRARTETAIGRSRVSVSSVAVELARGTLGELDSRRVLVIGAGENGELTAKALRERGVETVFVANRRYDRAVGLAQRLGGPAVRFDDLPRELQAADIVGGSTALPHH